MTLGILTAIQIPIIYGHLSQSRPDNSPVAAIKTPP
jgi:hypothetical protein